MSLTDPIALRGRTAPSRVLFGPHETNLARGREISDRHVAYYARRAAGGAGVIVTEVASVHPSDWPYERAPLAADAAAGWADVVRACRPHGTLVLAGLGHAGAQGSSAFGQQALWGPSRVADVASREAPMEVEQAEIDALVAGFRDAARFAARADLDGIEINAGQHSILRQFLSGLTNQRGDGYGGEEKDRLLRDVLAAVRDGLGDDRILGLRLCCDEMAPWAGITPEHAAATAAAVAGSIDYLAVVRGSGMSVPSTRPDLHTEPGFNRELCAGIRAGLRDAGTAVPVVFQGSVVDPAMAADALESGVADLVEMTRAQIAEPNLVALVRAGTPERIRPCTLSNQRSSVRDNRNPIVSDEAEPRSGHETEDAAVEGTDAHPHDVLVVGGGPAGMEAARVLASRGHRVRLVEKQAQLGGSLRLAAAVGGRARIGLLIPWWSDELTRLGVEVQTGVEIDETGLDAAARDGVAVLLATGSRPGPRAFPVSGGVEVRTVAEFERAVVDAGSTEQALAGLPEGAVVVYDPIGDWTGVGVAEQVAAAGRPTAIITQDQVAGTQLALTGDLAAANTRLQQAGVSRELRSLLRGVGAGKATVEDTYTGERREIDCAVLIDCGHRLPEETLWSARPHLPRAGDCVAPRTVHEAVLEGRRAALAIGAAHRAPLTTTGGTR
ncbi:mycofactocin system FadH/OYE family oxidoreductase 1 [Pseudonocardia sp. H11422]|uniref:mycofactocin system FadH/OYE family oxidoreductase 1 n=1 Tax=Pseudonocardia sp. H11422 TaxID=2835866 RepID=UPI001BDDBF2C|nr:mycofactocin system FadH/OYE family oxidoreductase 1 [Pseudonocardia sp. H11422]